MLIKAFGYTVHKKWECDFRQLLKENTEIAEIINNHLLRSKITSTPHDAFYRGRAENFMSFCEKKAGKKILFTRQFL